jgi:Lipopolysaccharide kinase (Kdo/WaaP) family
MPNPTTGPALPAGYERLHVGRADAVAVRALLETLRRVLADGTLYDFAKYAPTRARLAGRQPAFAVPLPAPESGRMVVRHNRHGGAMAGVTRDLFVLPTRAPAEFAIARRLADAGIPTPEVLAYVVYGAATLLGRSDVATREVAPGRDLAAILATADAADRTHALDAAAALVAALSRAGARHHDLNAKNVLIAGDSAGPTAYVLDVDRITFGGSPAATLDLNLARLARSLRKWRQRFGASISDEEIAALDTAARDRI